MAPKRGRNRSPSPDPDGMFAGMVVFMVELGVQRRRLEIWKQKLVQMGAVIEEDGLTKKVTHVLAMNPEALLDKFRKELLSHFKGRLVLYQWLEDSLTAGEKANEDLYVLRIDSEEIEEPNKSLPARSGSQDQTSTPKRIRDSPDAGDIVGLESHKNTQGSPGSPTSASPGEGIAEIPTSPQSESSSVYKPPDLNRNITEIFDWSGAAAPY